MLTANFSVGVRVNLCALRLGIVEVRETELVYYGRVRVRVRVSIRLRVISLRVGV